jgi:uncharacterized protein (TIGR03083 family)
VARTRTARDDAAVPTVRSAFFDAAAVVADLVDQIPATAWEGPGLGVWDLRALVGHTSRSLVTVAEYLTQRAAEEVTSPEAYYVVVARAVRGNADAVAERGRAAGAALGADPAAAFRALAAAAAEVLDRTGDDDVVPTAAGGMRVAAYLHTRVFELVVHGMDIAQATGLPVAFPAPVLADTAALAARVAVALDEGPVLLAALTGRASLPPGFTVV